MSSVRRWMRSPIDIIAPYSYRFMLLRAPMESLVEIMSTWSARIPWHSHMYLDPSDEPRVTEMNAPLCEWPNLLRLGYDEFVGGDRAHANFATYIIGATKNPEWQILLNVESGFSGFKNEVIRQALLDGIWCAPVPNFGGIDVVRQPNTEGLDGYRKENMNSVPESSRIDGSVPLESVSKVPFGCPMGVKGSRGLQVMGNGLIEKGLYFQHIGIFIGESGRYKKCIDWPVDNDSYRFEGIDKICGNKGRLHDRFTDHDMSKLLLELYGLDAFNVDFYTGDIVRVESGSFRGIYNASLVDKYRDLFMSGWRGEIRQ